MMNTRLVLRIAGTAALAVGTMTVAAAAAHRHAETPEPVTVTVFKDPNCGCCKLWVDHLRKHAFTVVAKDTSDVAAVKRTGRVPEQLHSCHTAFVNGYVIEGHVPAEDVKRLLAEKPRVAGIAVAGMPIGSPGMEMGDRKDRYDVVAFNRDGTTRVFAKR
jgi:hypothetical protein